MNVTAGQVFETSMDWGITGLAGTLRYRILDGDGGTTVAPTITGIAEFPAGSGRYEVNITAPSTVGQFFVFWDDGAVGDGHSAPGDDVTVIGFLVPDEVVGDAYATVEELFRILKIRTPSTEQENAAVRVLLAAATEINDEIDLPEDADALSAGHLALVAQVNLERAAELWELQEIHFGVVGLGSEFGATHIARNTWDKHAYTLANVKGQWGLA